MTKEDEIVALREENKGLHLRVTELEGLLKEALDKLNKNSSNSSKPPSSDAFRKPQSLRTASGKSPGGQPGHKGTTLEMRDVPDSIVLHEPLVCSHCQEDLRASAAAPIEKRQVYDLPPLRLLVTEHQVVGKTCPRCGTRNEGRFPLGLTQPVQYGEQLKALCAYLTNYQLLPYQRCAQLLEDVWGQGPCEATLVEITKDCANRLQPFEQGLKDVLLNCDRINCDETSCRVEGKTTWLHVTASGHHTLYGVHEKRGTKALQDIGILPGYKGVAMHDYWKAYLDYGCEHVFCHAHHLRELTFLAEEENSRWALEMKGLLTQIKQSVEEEVAKGGQALSAGVFAKHQHAYWHIMQRGESEHPLPEKEHGLPGRAARGKARNLWERFYRHASEMLHFACDFSVPFTNNIAEQALRMMKVKQKISGGFRSPQGAEGFARIRSYIDTLRKQGLPILEGLKKAIVGEAWLPLMPAPA